MHAGAVGVPFGAGVVFESWVGLLGVGEPLVLADEVDDVHPIAACAFIEPEFHDIVDGGADGRGLPIEIGLLGGEEGEIVLLACGVVCPGAVGVA